jgi:hypothetical protein
LLSAWGLNPRRVIATGARSQLKRTGREFSTRFNGF